MLKKTLVAVCLLLTLWIVYENTKLGNISMPSFLLDRQKKANLIATTNEPSHNEKLLAQDDRATSEAPVVNAARNLTFDQMCDKFGEWEMVGRRLFFKRSAAFYFQDAGFMRLHFLGNGDWMQLELFVDVRIKQRVVVERHRIDMSKIYMDSPWTVRSYSFAFIDAPLSLVELLRQNPIAGLDALNIADVLNDVEVRVNVSVKDTDQWSRQPLRAEAKLLLGDFDKKRASMMCTKCLYMTNERDLLSFKWWLEVNKRVGYERVAFCNQSIENSDSFRQLFAEHSSYITMTDLKCVPNLQDLRQTANNYYHSFFELTDAGQFDGYKVCEHSLIFRLFFLNNKNFVRLLSLRPK